jgi:hypothetical protein
MGYSTWKYGRILKLIKLDVDVPPLGLGHEYDPASLSGGKVSQCYWYLF